MWLGRRESLTYTDILPTESSHARRERKVHVTLQPDIIEKLNYTK
jgi:hypothetical protein